jgi:N-acetyl-anhydromuramyl-L-alanine amidase AmpD
MVSPNQEYLRRGNKIAGFVIHMTEGSFISAIDWCNNPKAQVSYHFIIDKNGDDVCLVMPENTAWHAGKIVSPRTDFVKKGNNPNFYSIGIALAGFASEGPTQSQIAKCARLINMLSVYYNIKLDKNTVIPHNLIRTDKLCPGLKVSIDSLVYLSSLPQ